MNDKRDIVVIGGSRGAFSVLRNLAEALPAGLPAAAFIVLHVGRHDSVLPELLSKWGKLPACHPVDGEPVSSGRIYVAPPGHHMRLVDQRVRLDEGAPENFARPAIDPLFRSAALAYGARVVAAVLSGDLDDGAAGLAVVRAHGGYCIIQDPADSEAPSMPRAALGSAGANHITNSQSLVQDIVAAVNGASREKLVESETMVADDFDLEARLSQQGLVQPEDLDRIGQRSPLTCPECGGAMWRMRSGAPLRFRCHTGHAFSALSLEDGGDRAAENAIWAAVRAVNERVILARERRDWATQTGDGQQQAAIEQARIDEGVRIAQVLKGLASSSA
ncbi:chemotaxis protein CheB [Paraburkholderia edwinii]|uniref:protein-glutamate methylesterase n=1 Tax=Paraburkholderia edwinii TaxID=2861782 RepID=A0ABX8URX1_9BURK|nr:chemotaxis protein CheB [Paraburkholderia edwinii]QYD70092.1 chemotaxis protein CheB [Paraburkholderia edwinii]